MTRAPNKSARSGLFIGILFFIASLSVVLLYAKFSSEDVSAEKPQLVKVPKISFAGLEQSQDILSSRDQFITALTPFDRSARMMSFKEISETDFLKFLRENAIAWNSDEMQKIRNIFILINNKIAPLNLTFPEEILLIKTTGKEELGGTYTRENAIIIPEKIANSSEDEIEKQITDSLFHIFLRYNPKVRDALCEVIGFVPCNEIEIPNELSHSKVTDPDAPQNNHYINVSYKGSAIQVVPIVLRGESWTCGIERKMCFSIEYKLLAIEKKNGTWKSKLIDSQPLLLEVSEVTGFYEKTGRNSKNIWHPEEIVVDNLVILINDDKDIPTPGIVTQMQKFLTK